jgi:hypothetical protein
MDVEELHKDVVRLGNRNGLRIFAAGLKNGQRSAEIFHPTVPTVDTWS